jgi:translation initiation factor 2 beta subunit (eIF-2beta)/eIF-5
LEDIYDTLDQNSNLFGKSEIKVAKPEARFDKTKKTIWSNFRSICKEIKSGEEQVAKFFAKEYSAMLSINQEGHLLIKGKYSDIMVSSTLKKYILPSK